MGDQRRSNRRATRRIAMCSVFCALAVVLLGMGTVIEVLDISAAAAASLILLPVLLCYGNRYALLSYAVTSVLSLVLLPQSLAAWMFAGLTGYYPIVKTRLDRLPRVLGWLIKLALMIAVCMIYMAVFCFLILGGEKSLWEAFLLSFGEADGSPVFAVAALILGLVTFVLFDILINRLLVVYYIKWQKRVERWMKP